MLPLLVCSLPTPHPPPHLRPPNRVSYKSKYKTVCHLTLAEKQRISFHGALAEKQRISFHGQVPSFRESDQVPSLKSLGDPATIASQPVVCGLLDLDIHAVNEVLNA
jgi:hypothetical protein